jgi:hypothetical protein
MPVIQTNRDVHAFNPPFFQDRGSWYQTSVFIYNPSYPWVPPPYHLALSSPLSPLSCTRLLTPSILLTISPNIIRHALPIPYPPRSPNHQPLPHKPITLKIHPRETSFRSTARATNPYLRSSTPSIRIGHLSLLQNQFPRMLSLVKRRAMFPRKHTLLAQERGNHKG